MKILFLTLNFKIMNVYRTLFLLFTLYFFLANVTAFAQQLKDRDNRPNVILIYADDLGYGDLSSYGAKAIETPNIDNLAREGVKFTNAHSTASTCTPSRYSMMTGTYAFRNKNIQILPGNASMLISPKEVTMAKIFQRANYKTAIVGKWHIGLGGEGGPDWNGEVKPGMKEMGFDYSFYFPATADRVPTVFLENDKVVALSQDDPIAVSYEEKIGNEPTVKTHPELLKMKSSLGHDGTIVNGIGRIGWMKGGKLARWNDEELADTFLLKAKDFIEDNKKNPFFLFYSINEPHVPRMPNTRFKGKSKLGYRGDAILEADFLVGAIVEILENNSLREKTIVIFTSDNGPVLDDGYEDNSVELAHQYNHSPSGSFRGGKYSMFEGGTRVPFILNWKGSTQPKVSDALVSQMDLYSSFAEMVDQLQLMTGKDSQPLMEVFLGNKDKGRSDYIQQNNDGVLAYIKDGWKYIEPYFGPKDNNIIGIETGLSETPQLYDLNTDKEERFDVAKKNPLKIREMKKELDNIRNNKSKRHLRIKAKP